MNGNYESEGNGWTRYQKLVLAELERNSKLIEDLRTDFNEHRIQTKLDINTIKIKTGALALLSGAIPSALIIFIETLRSH